MNQSAISPRRSSCFRRCFFILGVAALLSGSWQSSAVAQQALPLGNYPPAPNPQSFNPTPAQPGPQSQLFAPPQIQVANWQGAQPAPPASDILPAAPSVLPEPIGSNDAEIDVLRSRLDALEKEIAASKKKDDKKSDSKDKKDDGGWVDISKEKWTNKIGGHVQMDYINWAHADPAIPGAVNYFEFRRLRLTADGTGYGFLDYRLQMTLEPEAVGTNPPGVTTSPDVKDAYFSMNEIPLLGRFRIGNFFVPFGLEQVTNDTNNVFLERSIPTQNVFTAEREVGIAFYNCTENQNFTWTTGCFFDSISEALKERLDNNQGYRLSQRFTWLPYYDEPSNGRYLVHTGAGILYTDDQDNVVKYSSRPQIHEGPKIIDSGNIAASAYTNANVEFAVVWANITVQTEAYISTPQVVAGPNPTVHGAYLHTSYFLTGENRIYQKFGQHGAQFGRNEPFSNFFIVPGQVSLGAIELKARWSYLNLNELGTGVYDDLTLGFNWYWTDRTRIMFDYIHPWTTADAVFGATQSDILAMRFDWNW